MKNNEIYFKAEVKLRKQKYIFITMYYMLSGN